MKLQSARFLEQVQTEVSDTALCPMDFHNTCGRRYNRIESANMNPELWQGY
jgi:hypothetical protein